MKVLITSDSHDNWKNLEAAISIGNEQGCEVKLHAGDFVTPAGISLLDKFNGEIHIVWGNNEGEKEGWRIKVSKRDKITHYGDTMEGEVGSLKFYMNHYPIQAHNAAESGKYDVCVYGHDHEYYDETLPNGTRLLNPGEIVGWKTGVATCMIFDTETGVAEKIVVAENQYML